ncbi:ubiquinol-cytochrome c reductase cytochrome b subunit, partial [Streptomyces sp. NPDC029704]
FLITKRWCLGLQRRDREKILHGRESGVIVRRPHGEYVEIHEPLPQADLYTLTAHDQPRPYELPPPVDENGVPRKVGWPQRLRARLARTYYGPYGQIAKPTAEEYRAVHAAHESVEHHKLAERSSH